jgi:hypothetical protein
MSSRPNVKPARSNPAAPLRHLLLLGAALFAASACSEAPSIEPFVGDVEFAILHTQHAYGNIEPCSCNNRQTGGFPRRCTAISALKQDGQPFLVLDAGDSLFSEDGQQADPMHRAQAKVKAKAIAEAFVRCGLDGFVFGELDLVAGGDFFVQVAKETGLPVIAANVFERVSGKPLFETHKIFDLGGLKVAVIGLVPQEVHPAITETRADGTIVTRINDRQPLLLEEAFANRDVKIEDPISVAKQLVPKLAREAHLVVALAHLPARLSDELPALVPGLSLVVGRHTPTTAARGATLLNGALMLSTSMNGTSIGVGRFRVRAGSLDFEDHSKVDVARELIPELEALRNELIARFGTDDPERVGAIDPQAGQKLLRLTTNLEEQKALLAAAGTDRSSFSHETITLDGKVHGDDPAIHEFVRDYRASLAALYDASDTTRSPSIEATLKEAHYVGGEACASCHRPQHEFWKQTAHGHAWQTMLDERAQFDLECIYCHTLGFMKPGGFDRPDRVSGRENVQCENCHGPGSNHLKNVLTAGAIHSDAAAMNCQSCHNKEHSPSFEFATYVPRASCPPLDSWEPVIRGTYGKLREDLERRFEQARAEGKVPAPFLYSGLLDLHLRLERYEDAVAIADAGIAAHPTKSRGLSLGKARALEGLGRSHEALDLLDVLYRENPDDPRVLVQNIEFLLTARDPSARDLARADEFVEYGLSLGGEENGVFRIYRADVLHASGDLDGAIGTLKAILAKADTRSSTMQRKLEAWIAERDARREFAMPPPLATPPAR